MAWRIDQVGLAAIIPGMERPSRSEIADARTEVFNAGWLRTQSQLPSPGAYVPFHASVSVRR
jgi:hypothetical protein